MCAQALDASTPILPVTTSCLPALAGEPGVLLRVRVPGEGEAKGEVSPGARRSFCVQ